MHVSQTIEGLNNGNFIAEFDSWTPFSTIWISASWLTGHAIANKGHMQIPNNMHVLNETYVSVVIAGARTLTTPLR